VPLVPPVSIEKRSDERRVLKRLVRAVNDADKAPVLYHPAEEASLSVLEAARVLHLVKQMLPGVQREEGERGGGGEGDKCQTLQGR
jgi:hypothetical protein